MYRSIRTRFLARLLALKRATDGFMTTPAQRSLGVSLTSLLLAAGFRSILFLDASGVNLPSDGIWTCVAAMLAAAASDVMVAGTLGLIHYGMTCKLRSFPASRVAMFAGYLLLFPGTLLHVISVPFFRLYQMPLRYTQLLLVGSLSNILDSAHAEITRRYLYLVLLVLVLAAGTAVAGATYIYRAYCARAGHGKRRIVLGAAIGLVACCLIAVRSLSGISNAPAGLIMNPSQIFVESWVQWCWHGVNDDIILKHAPHFDTTRLFDKDSDNDQLQDLVRPDALPVSGNNVILIVVESASVNRFGLWGGDVRTTPRLAQLKPHALMFDSYYSPAPVSMKSLVSLMCSTYPHADPRADTYTNPTIDCRSLSEVLADAGYDAGLFHAGHFSYTDKDRFFAHRGYSIMRDAGSLRNEAKYPINGWGIDERAMFDDAIHWLNGRDSQLPFFLTLITLSPHHPYKINNVTPAPFGTASAAAKYDNAVHLVDSQIGRIWDWLVQKGLQNKTLLAIVGDHGEAFGEHPGHFVHGSLIYEEAVRTPLMLVQPLVFKGVRTRRIGNHVDLAPTLLDIIGHPRPKRYQGVSLLRGFQPHMVYFYANWSAYRLGLRDGRWKYIYHPLDGVHELFDLRKDPQERVNLAASNPSHVEAYQHRVTAWEVYYGTLIPNYESYVLGATMCPRSPVCYLSTLEPSYTQGAWRKDQSVSTRPLRIQDTFYDKGIGVKPLSVLRYSISGGNFQRLKGMVGYDGYVKKSQLNAVAGAAIYVDDKLMWSSGKIGVMSDPRSFDISVENGRLLELISYDLDGSKERDAINWVDVRLER